MNPVAEEIESYIGSSSMSGKDFLEHYGIRRRSGRYPWGSGKDPYQSGRDFLGRVEEMRKSGFTYTDENGKKWTGDPAIAKSLGYSTTDFRTVYAIAKDERRSDMVATARRLKEKEGMNNSEIGRKMGINESSVRSLLDPNSESKMKQAREYGYFRRERSGSCNSSRRRNDQGYCSGDHPSGCIYQSCICTGVSACFLHCFLYFLFQERIASGAQA